MKLNNLTLMEAKKGLENKKFSAVDLVSACLRQIEKTDSQVRAFLTVCKKEALSRAKKADERPKRGLLEGIPIAIKDNFLTKGVKTTAASRVLEGYLPVYDATVVKRLKQAGAIVIGKTNMDAWAHGSSTETSAFFTTRNPWDLNRLPGGSSGGSAAAVAAEQTIVAVGSETAGSIRQPAAWCGVVGLKPTYGRVSRYGVIAMASSTDSPGPITKRVEDSAVILQTLAGLDGYDATLSPEPVDNYCEEMKKGIRELKVGLPKQYFGHGVDPEVDKYVKNAAKKIEAMGAKIAWIDLLEPKYSVAVYTIIQRSEVSSNLARYDGVRYGFERDKFGDEAKRRIMLGTYALSAGFYDEYYTKAQRVRTLLIKNFEKVFKKVDLFLAPTSPSTALPVGATEGKSMFGEMQDVLVEASSLAGLPGINITCGFSSKGLPIGMQIVGPQFSESLILRLAYAYEQATDWHKRKPKLN